MRNEVNSYNCSQIVSDLAYVDKLENNINIAIENQNIAEDFVAIAIDMGGTRSTQKTQLEKQIHLLGIRRQYLQEVQNEKCPI